MGRGRPGYCRHRTQLRNAAPSKPRSRVARLRGYPLEVVEVDLALLALVEEAERLVDGLGARPLDHLVEHHLPFAGAGLGP